MAYRVRARRGVNISRVVTKIVATVLALYVGGTIMTVLGEVMNGTCSPFYRGLRLIGWTVGSGTCSDTSATNANTITATTGTGVLAVIGIIGIAAVVLEFISFSRM